MLQRRWHGSGGALGSERSGVGFLSNPTPVARERRLSY